MFLLSFARIFRFAFQSFIRNIWLSVVTITIIILTCFSLTSLVLVNVISDQAMSSIKNKIDISLYFESGTSEEQATLVMGQLSKIEHVKNIEHITADKALTKFSQTHYNDQVVQDAISELEGENPLGPLLVVKADDVKNYPKILDDIKMYGIEKIIKEIDYNDRTVLIEKIESFGIKVKNFSLVLSFIFACIALLVVFNTIRIGIYVHGEEINIMKLVGASNWFIRGPFIVESALYALFGCLIFWLIFYLLAGLVNPIVAGFFAGFDFNLMSYLSSNFFFIFSFELLLIILLCVLSSLLAVSKYLRHRRK